MNSQVFLLLHQRQIKREVATFQNCRFRFLLLPVFGGDITHDIKKLLNNPCWGIIIFLKNILNDLIRLLNNLLIRKNVIKNDEKYFIIILTI